MHLALNPYHAIISSFREGMKKRKRRKKDFNDWTEKKKEKILLGEFIFLWTVFYTLSLEAKKVVG